MVFHHQSLNCIERTGEPEVTVHRRLSPLRLLSDTEWVTWPLPRRETNIICSPFSQKGNLQTRYIVPGGKIRYMCLAGLMGPVRTLNRKTTAVPPTWGISHLTVPIIDRDSPITCLSGSQRSTTLPSSAAAQVSLSHFKANQSLATWKEQNKADTLFLTTNHENQPFGIYTVNIKYVSIYFTSLQNWTESCDWCASNVGKTSDLNMRIREQILQLQTFLLLTGLKNFLNLNINKDI